MVGEGSRRLYNDDGEISYISLPGVRKILNNVMEFSDYRDAFERDGSDPRKVLEYINRIRTELPNKLRDNLYRGAKLDDKSLEDLEGV